MKNIFKNKKILVTGGTGSFGQEFVKTLCKNFNFKKLAIFSRDELKQFEMSERLKDSRLRFLLGDLRDYDRVKFALSDIDFVIHAAALKQVPKAEYNPSEYIKTNILGSENIIKASIETKVSKVLSLSTDKAASPINLYGATKLVADKLFAAANNMTGKKKILFSTVRYGNVLNSRGSVIPFFKQQISQNKPLPITHNDTTRFFLSLNEGVNFVTNSFKIMKGGEIFIPKIPSFKIKELADCMSPKVSKKIIGLRPGEKIHEVLISRDETNVYEYKKFFVIAPSIIMDKSKNYKSYLLEKGKKVKINFEYGSNLNSKFLNKTNLKKYIKNFI